MQKIIIPNDSMEILEEDLIALTVTVKIVVA